VTKRELLHAYIKIKLEERDYHAVSDAANDLRELEVKNAIQKRSAEKEVCRVGEAGKTRAESFRRMVKRDAKRPS
jgi:hypothetical protein